MPKFVLDVNVLIYFRVKIEGDNEPEPSVPRLEGNVPFIFVGTKVRNDVCSAIKCSDPADFDSGSLIWGISKGQDPGSAMLLLNRCYSNKYNG
jgi:hypothetical protein